jgi:hypothetical protein
VSLTEDGSAEDKAARDVAQRARLVREGISFCFCFFISFWQGLVDVLGWVI